MLEVNTLATTLETKKNDPKKLFEEIIEEKYTDVLTTFVLKEIEENPTSVTASSLKEKVTDVFMKLLSKEIEEEKKVKNQ